MPQTITLHVPDDTAEYYRRGATAARKPLEQFLLERLGELVPQRVEPLPDSVLDELRRMEDLDDAALWEITRSTLPPARQRLYDRLLRKNAESTLGPREQETLRAIGEEARRLTLKKAHAWLVLKWRDHPVQAPR